MDSGPFICSISFLVFLVEKGNIQVKAINHKVVEYTAVVFPSIPLYRMISVTFALRKQCVVPTPLAPLNPTCQGAGSEGSPTFDPHWLAALRHLASIFHWSAGVLSNSGIHPNQSYVLWCFGALSTPFVLHSRIHSFEKWCGGEFSPVRTTQWMNVPNFLSFFSICGNTNPIQSKEEPPTHMHSMIVLSSRS
jgi:hypothetical protein